MLTLLPLCRVTRVSASITVQITRRTRNAELEKSLGPIRSVGIKLIDPQRVGREVFPGEQTRHRDVKS